jgi:hypothetical protein
MVQLKRNSAAIVRFFLPLLMLWCVPEPGVLAQDAELYLEYHRYSEKIANRDDTPQLRVYGSGRVETYHPAYSANAGRYAMRLPASELNGLLQSLRAGGLFELDPDEIRQEHKAAEQSRRQREGTLFYSSDATVSYLRVQWPGEPPVQLTFTNLQPESSRLPQAAALNRLAAIERRLWKLRDDPRLQRFADPGVMQGR